MKSDRFLVRTTVKDHTFTRVWNAEEPLSLGTPFRWVIENTDKGVRIHDISSPIDITSREKVQTIDSKSLDKGKKIQLIDKGRNALPSIELSIQKLEKISPTYDQKKSKLSGNIQVFTCQGSWIRNHRTITHSESFSVQDVELFNLSESKNELRITPLVEGLELREKNKKPIKLKKSSSYTVSTENLQSTCLEFESTQWRFSRAITPKIEENKETQSEDLLYFIKATKGAFVGLIALISISFLWPSPDPKEEEELVPAQFAKVVMAPSAQSQKVDSQPQSNQSIKSANQTQVAQAFRSKALRSAVSNLLKGGITQLANSNTFITRNGSLQAQAMMNRKSNQLGGKISKNALTHKNNAQVNTLGSGKNGGYSKGSHAKVSGQGGAFVDMNLDFAEVQEGLSKDEVGKVIHKHMSEVRYCYESSLVRNPSTQGKVVIEFNINSNGRVAQSSIKESNTKAPRLDDCLMRRLKSWHFPKPKGGVSVAVSYPFVFKKLGR